MSLSGGYGAKTELPKLTKEPPKGGPLLELPTLPTLLTFLQADTLLCLVSVSSTFLQIIRVADGVWTHRIADKHGGTEAAARARFGCTSTPPTSQSSLSAYELFLHLCNFRQILESRIVVRRGDLRFARDHDVDAVVCPAVPNLQPYGPAARAVYAEAGQELMDHIAEELSNGALESTIVSPGECFWTPAFGLGLQNGIVHAVGPNQRTANGHQCLRKVYRNALKTAMAHGAKSVAVGSISTGGNGFDARLGARIAMEEFREALASLSRSGEDVPLKRIVIIAYEEEIFDAFAKAQLEVVRRVNSDLLEQLPLVVMDSMVPKQRLTFVTEERWLHHPEIKHFGMLGLRRVHSWSNGGVTLASHGVEVEVLSRKPSSPGCVEIEIVAGRRFAILGYPQSEEMPLGANGELVGNVLLASVEWLPDLTSRASYGQRELEIAQTIPAQVAVWLHLVRGGHERAPGQIDCILRDIGPMPLVPGDNLDKLAFWVAALINPLPALGVAKEIRPQALAAASTLMRLRSVVHALEASIAMLRGSETEEAE